MNSKKTIFTLSALAIASFAMAQAVLTPKNIDQIVSQMTLEEKAQLLVGRIDGTNYSGVPLPNQKGDPNAQRVEGAAGQTCAIGRLGIPATVVADGPAGVRVLPKRQGDDRTYYCTGFPVEILLASSWNTPLVEEVGRAMGNEVKERGVDVLLAPATNIMRNPLCGRNFEYFSEDPLLAGKMTASIVRGIQSEGVGTSVKHFAANNQETNRYRDDSRVSQRALREIYLKPFEIAVREAQPWTVMSSYNMLNGEFTQESHDLLTSVLRNDWGFQGLVMTDWTPKRNTARQIAAGNDLMMPGYQDQIDDIVNSVKNGSLSEKDLDLCVRRMLEYIVRTPSFANYKYSDQPDLTAHAQVARQAAAEGVVLLKNNGILPLTTTSVKPDTSDSKTLQPTDALSMMLAQISQQKKREPDGKIHVALFGFSSYNFIHDGFGSGHVNSPYVVNMTEGLRAGGVVIDTQLEDVYQQYNALEHKKFALAPISKLGMLEASGFGPHIEELDMPDYAVKATVGDNDVAVITIGRKPGEAFDRTIPGDFNLSDTEQKLIKTVSAAYHAAGKKVVVVLNVGAVVETASWRDLPDAILLTWMPGQEGGHVVADALLGKVNPSGKLPATFPVDYFDVPGAQDFPYDQGKDYSDGMLGISALITPKATSGNDRNLDFTNYDEDIFVGYRGYKKPVAYPFGFGLSYTTFSFARPQVTTKGDRFVARVTVTNTGSMAGKEVVQLYVSAPRSSLDKPERELKAFAKTRLLQPGESQTVELTFSTYDLASFDESRSAFVTDAGQYKALFCTDALTARQTATFTVKKVKAYPVSNVLKRTK